MYNKYIGKNLSLDEDRYELLCGTISNMRSEDIIDLYNLHLGDDCNDKCIYHMDSIDEQFAGMSPTQILDAVNSDFNTAHDCYFLRGSGFSSESYIYAIVHKVDTSDLADYVIENLDETAEKFDDIREWIENDASEFSDQDISQLNLLDSIADEIASCYDSSYEHNASVTAPIIEEACNTMLSMGYDVNYPCRVEVSDDIKIVVSGVNADDIPLEERNSYFKETVMENQTIAFRDFQELSERLFSALTYEGYSSLDVNSDKAERHLAAFARDVASERLQEKEKAKLAIQNNTRR